MTEFNFWQIESGSTHIHLMSYSDFDPNKYIDHLTGIEQERFFSFKHIQRKREFIATRILRHKVFGFQHIHYSTIGAPYIEDEGFISISHSPHLAGIAVNKEYMIGLDLEWPRENILEIAPKFITQKELDFFDGSNKLEMTKVWSTKEAMYKLAGRKKIIFKKELLLSKDENGQWLGEIVNPDHTLRVKIAIFDHQGTVVSINSCAIERIENDL